ncbi:hypothetical protein F4604DRAFT_1916045 [Suillus subluteus]|nr:hypothetical protein F4604DRAFT_1916045 [Suillus subluteus]
MQLSHETRHKRVTFPHNAQHSRARALRAFSRLSALHHLSSRNIQSMSIHLIDPDVVIRGTHLIPIFEKGHTNGLLPESFVRCEADLGTDWLNFYVNTDMFMHYRGGGVGYKISRGWDEFLQSDGAHVEHVEEEGDRDADIEDEEDEDEEADDEEDDDGEDDDGDDDEDEDEDRIEADKGEELDDDFLAAEGYGAL